MSDSIIKVQNLSKLYRLKHQQSGPRDGLRHVLNNWVTAPFRWAKSALSTSRPAPSSLPLPLSSLPLAPGSTLPAPSSLPSAPTASPLSLSPLPLAPGSTLPAPCSEDFWALKDVSFEIKQGEVVGIIGRNGAGKSTLLKILSRITEPTSGRIEINGRVASLLEVGTGFHPELTGRENIFLNGAILGMSKAEIKSKFDEIVDFAEVEKFLDTPVKRYSSGMYVRLAFAVAAHLEPEILIVDEVLAVGDAEFQKKCLGKMQDVSKGGRTVIFVSHNMAAVNRLCQKVLLFHKGAITAHGDTGLIVAKYYQSGLLNKTHLRPGRDEQPIGNGIVTLLALDVAGTDGSMGPSFGHSTAIKVTITYRVKQPVFGLRMGLQLLSADGVIIFNATNTDGDVDRVIEQAHAVGEYFSSCTIPSGFLNRGQYSIAVGSDTPVGVNFYHENAISFFIVPEPGDDTRNDSRPGLITPRLLWEKQSVPCNSSISVPIFHS